MSDIRAIVNLEEPAISPDGTRVAFLVVRSDYARNAFVNELWIEDVKSRTVTRLVQGEDVAVPRWSPSGTQLAYLARQSDSGRLALLVSSLGGPATVVARNAGDLVDFAWSPDGSQIAYTAYDAPDARHPLYFEVGNNDYTATSIAAPAHLWVVPSRGGSPRRLTSGSWTVAPTDPGGIFTSQFAWSHDGSRLFYTRIESTFSGENERSTIRALAVSGGETARLTNHREFEFTPMVSPDGGSVAYSYPEAGNYLAQNELHLITGASDAIVSRALDRNVGGALWMPDGKALLACGDDGAHGTTWLIHANGEVHRLGLDGLTMACDSYSSSEFDSGVAASVARDGAVAFVATDSSHARELFYLDSIDGHPQQLTHFNAFLSGLDLGSMKQFHWDGPNGFRESGVVTYPPNMRSGVKYPVVLFIHGGPGLSSIDSFVWEAWPEAQLIASRGYIVFQPNYRGSDGDGNAFMLAIAGDSVRGPSADILAGLRRVKQLPQADASRVAVCGWSYGGLLTSWLTTQRHDWKAAISGAAVNDEVEEYDLSTSNVQNRYYMGVTPYERGGMARYTDQSPITYADRITTPMLIWSTTGDPVVPTTMSYSMYHALREHHVPVKFVEFVSSTHGPSSPMMTEQLTTLWLDWLDRYLK